MSAHPPLVDLARPVADAASVERSDAVVDVVADAVRIHIGGAVTTADAEGVELIAVAVTVSGRDVGASTLVDVARSVADATSVERSDAAVDVVADAVRIHIGGAVTTADAEGVELIAVAVTVSGRDAISSANAAFVQLQTGAVFICCGRIVVAGGIIGAPDFILIAYPVSV